MADGSRTHRSNTNKKFSNFQIFYNCENYEKMKAHQHLQDLATYSQSIKDVASNQCISAMNEGV